MFHCKKGGGGGEGRKRVPRGIVQGGREPAGVARGGSLNKPDFFFSPPPPPSSVCVCALFFSLQLESPSSFFPSMCTVRTISLLRKRGKEKGTAYFGYCRDKLRAENDKCALPASIYPKANNMTQARPERAAKATRKQAGRDFSIPSKITLRLILSSSFSFAAISVKDAGSSNDLLGDSKAAAADGAAGAAAAGGGAAAGAARLSNLRYGGYSAEFLDRVAEPNGNIPHKQPGKGKE